MSVFLGVTGGRAGARREEDELVQGFQRGGGGLEGVKTGDNLRTFQGREYIWTQHFQ